MIMKIWKYILSAAALLALGACNHDADEMVIPTRNLDIAAHNAVVVNDVTAAEEFTLTWSAAKFGVQTEVEYTVPATVERLTASFLLHLLSLWVVSMLLSLL